jgi:hypothetical protein
MLSSKAGAASGLETCALAFSPSKKRFRRFAAPFAAKSSIGATKPCVVVPIVRVIVVADRAAAIIRFVDPRAAAQNSF